MRARAKNVDGDFHALPDAPGRVRVDLDAGSTPPISLTFVVSALHAEKMGKALIGAAKLSRNKRALAKLAQQARDLFTIKPGDL